MRYELRSVLGVLAVNENQSLVALVLQGLHLAYQFLVREGVPHGGAQGAAESAVLAVIGAVVADVKGGEEHNAVAVDRALEFPGGLEDFVQALWRVHCYKRGCFLNSQGLFGKGLLKDFPIDCRVFLGIVYQGLQPVVVDKVDKAFSPAQSPAGQ